MSNILLQIRAWFWKRPCWLWASWACLAVRFPEERNRKGTEGGLLWAPLPLDCPDLLIAMNELPHLVWWVLEVALVVVDLVASHRIAEWANWKGWAFHPPTYSLILDMGKQIEASELRLRRSSECTFSCDSQLLMPSQSNSPKLKEFHGWLEVNIIQILQQYANWLV